MVKELEVRERAWRPSEGQVIELVPMDTPAANKAKAEWADYHTWCSGKPELVDLTPGARLSLWHLEQAALRGESSE